MDLARVMASFVPLYTKTTFEIPGGEIAEHLKVGSGVILDGRYVLTVEHVVVQNGYSVSTPFGPIQVLAEKISEETYFQWKNKKYPLRMVYKNKDEDIALLEILSEVRPPSFPYQIGNSDDLRVGNFVYVVGNPLSIGINVREGIVSATKAPPGISASGVEPRHMFMVSNGLMPGDSGSPIIAIRDGRFELVGISQGTISQNTRLSWGIRINVIRNLLRSARAVPMDKWAMPKKKAEQVSARNSGEAGGEPGEKASLPNGERREEDPDRGFFLLGRILHPLGISPEPEKNP
jgi:S1-C subfamily serine protease